MKQFPRNTSSAFWRDCGGASALEFAIILPVFVTMVLGTIQMGIVFYTAGSVQFALEKTAREIMVDPDMSEGQIETAIESKLVGITTQGIEVTYTVDSSNEIAIGQVNAAYTVELIIPFIPAFELTFDAETHIPLGES